MADPITCPVCNESIGVYEPVEVVSRGQSRRTSLAREPQLTDDPSVVLIHDACS